MPQHGATLVATLAAALGLALVLGFAAARLRLPPLVGYLLAGIVIGPATPGIVADVALARELAEVGIMLMMFGVGLHFSLSDLLAVRRVVLPGAVVQMALVTALGAFTARLWGWSVPSGLVFGVALAVASTVVLLRTLEGRRLLGSMNGRIAVGWLVVQDLVTVLILVLLPVAAQMMGVAAPPTAGVPWLALAATLAKVAAFLLFMLVVARRAVPWLLWQIAGSGSRELFTLAVVSSAVGVAYTSARFFNVSVALGAFFAGMMMRESDFSHRAAEESLPLRDAFSVLFFVSVGMLFEPRVFLDEPGKLAAALAVVVVGNTAVAVAVVLAFRYPLNTALTVGAGLGQIGEFSFILGELGVGVGLLPEVGRSLIIAAAILSIALNPLVFATTYPIQSWVRSRSAIARALEQRDDPLAILPAEVDSETLTGHAVIVGYGRVGKRIAKALEERGIRYVVAEVNREAVEGLRARGMHAVTGDASDPAVLVQAHVARARLLVVATPDTLKARRMVELARTLNPRVECLLRTHTDAEADLMRAEGLGRVFMGEEELAAAMATEALARMAEAGARA